MRTGPETAQTKPTHHHHPGQHQYPMLRGEAVGIDHYMLEYAIKVFHSLILGY